MRRLACAAVLLLFAACVEADVGPMHALIADSHLIALQERMDAGTLSAEELTAHFTRRIARIDPQLHAVIAVNPDALKAARALDEERARTGGRGWLHGIPVLIKDNIETRDPLATTAGSLALRDNRVGRDAPIVAGLRAAGAVILGKTNLSEWANFRSVRSTSGWSAVGGQARNPYDRSRSACGSSSGSAIAVAAGLAIAAVGTETDGSVICPASLTGVVGFKPAVGELSQKGIVPVAHSQDTAGPLTRSVVDAAILAAAMAGSDHRSLVTDLVQGDPATLLAGRRLGVVRVRGDFGAEVEALLEAALAALQSAGAEVVDGVDLDTPEGFRRATFEVLLYEFKHDLNAYLATLPGALGQLRLRDLIAFNEARPAEEMPHFGQEIFELAQAKGGLTDPQYLEALALAQDTTREGIDGLVRSRGLDVLISPSTVPAWPIDPLAGDPHLPSSSSYAAVAGYPHVTVPMGYVEGLPVGLSFYTRPADRDALLRIARAYELLAPARRWPELD